jgi:protein involved in polysaccharide export with SLBB domain
MPDMPNPEDIRSRLLTILMALGCVLGAAVPSQAQEPAAVAPPAPTTPSPAPVEASTPTPVGPVGMTAAPAARADGGFGYDYFSAAGGVADGPIDDDYLLSPRDEVVVTLWGELNETMNLTVGDQGFIELPEDGGRIQANGVRLRDLRPLVIRALSQIRAGYINAQDEAKSTAFVDIRLGRIRPMVFSVVGEAVKPGAYPVSAAAANVINLLNLAGGVRPTGTLREIRIKRANGRTDVVDLYGFFLRGDMDARELRLQPGDYVLVPIKRRAAAVEGQVRRPMTYELLEGDGLRALVELAGGFSPNASLRQAQLKRTEPNVGDVVRDLDLAVLLDDPSRDLPLQDGDTLVIPRNVQVRRPVVSVRGEGVVRPGIYEWTPGMRLSDLIAKGDGLREHAFLDRADLVRTEDDFSKRLMSFSLGDLYQRAADGTFTLHDDPEGNFALREMDEVIVQSAWGLTGRDKTVTVQGHVREPGPTALAQGMTLHDLLFMRGGFQDPDFRKLAYPEVGHLMRKVPGAVGTKLIPFHLGNVLAEVPGADLALEDGDVVRIYAFDDLSIRPDVRVDGLVRNPGTFPFADSMSLRDAVLLAGGLRPEVVMAEAVVARSVDSTADRGIAARTEETAVVVPLGEGVAPGADGAAGRFMLSPYDRITVRHRRGWEPRPSVTLRGEVAYPGSYTMPYGGERLTQALKRAGGLAENAYPQGAVLRRLTSNTDISTRDSAARTEVTISLVDALAAPGGPADLLLADDDELLVPDNPGTVVVRGAVQRPMALQHRGTMKLSDYLTQCGGLLDKADAKRITITAPNNASTLVAAGQDPVLLAGSTVEVPLQRESERMQVVEIKGAVAKPALIQHMEGAALGYYLGLSGGYTPNADTERVVVVLPDGRILEREPGKPFNPIIPPGAMILVTARPVTEATR